MKNYLLVPILAVGLLSCSDDDDTGTVDPVEEATFEVTITNVSTEYPIFQSGVFNVPVGEADAGPAFPGQSYSVSFYATPGMYLSLATMLVQTNDVFIAPADDAGIPLFNNNDEALDGDITSLFALWDAGTEVNEEPGVGENQAPRQSGPDTGTEENGTVSPLANVNDGYMYPNVDDVVSIVIDAADDGSNMFTLTIANISNTSSLAGPVSPGAYAIHTTEVQLFEDGMAASDGIEDIAEDGDPSVLGTFAVENTGLTTPFSPGVYAVYEEGSTPLFREGQSDAGDGLEDIAEDGSPASLAAVLSADSDVLASGVFNTPVSATSPGPIFPGQSYSFTISATPGDRLNLATMFIQSNDLFIAYGEEGLSLFNGNNPVEGDVTSGFQIWDAGTEVNEFPGAGSDQAPRQSAADTGTDESQVIGVVSDGFMYPSVSDIIRITLEVQ